MLQVFGTKDDREYELGQFETQEAALQLVRREEGKGYYSDLRVQDHDEYATAEYAKLPRHELERLAGMGDKHARAAMAASPADEPTEPIPGGGA